VHRRRTPRTLDRRRARSAKRGGAVRGGVERGALKARRIGDDVPDDSRETHLFFAERRCPVVSLQLRFNLRLDVDGEPHFDLESPLFLLNLRPFEIEETLRVSATCLS
jgi:hypothetical protein